MTLEQATKIVEAIENDGGSASVYEEYSGRGMFGRTCVGIVTDSPESVGYAAAEVGVPKKDLPTRRDSMGRDLILY
jgi:hypothetical protein